MTDSTTTGPIGKDELRRVTEEQMVNVFKLGMLDQMGQKNKPDPMPALKEALANVLKAIDAYTIEAEKRAELKGRHAELNRAFIDNPPPIPDEIDLERYWDEYYERRDAELHAQLHNLNTKEGKA